MINIKDLVLEIALENETLRTRIDNTRTTYPSMDPAALLLADVGLALYERLGDLMRLQVTT